MMITINRLEFHPTIFVMMEVLLRLELLRKSQKAMEASIIIFQSE